MTIVLKWSIDLRWLFDAIFISDDLVFFFICFNSFRHVERLNGRFQRIARQMLLHRVTTDFTWWSPRLTMAYVAWWWWWWWKWWLTLTYECGSLSREGPRRRWELCQPEGAPLPEAISPWIWGKLKVYVNLFVCIFGFLYIVSKFDYYLVCS